MKKGKEFSHDALIESFMAPAANPDCDNEMYKTVDKISDIVFQRVDSDKSIFELYSREEIEWFCDMIRYWPTVSDSSNDSQLSHWGIQKAMMSSIISAISSGVPEKRQKGIVFI